jgi:hypothetical protein
MNRNLLKKTDLLCAFVCKRSLFWKQTPFVLYLFLNKFKAPIIQF